MNVPTSEITLGTSTTQLFSLIWDQNKWEFTFSASWVLAAAIMIICVAAIIWKWRLGGLSLKNFEIDQAEIGIGQSKFRFRPNLTDKQVAYAIWVELSTRKIGLPIDLKHDVVIEVYDSWYNFFSVTRDLLKSIPVLQIKRDGTQAIIRLSIEVLNEGLRPHLTEWQARFRAWYGRELKKYEQTADLAMLDPQEIQQKFPKFRELEGDMMRVNNALIKYRAKMRELVIRD